MGDIADFINSQGGGWGIDCDDGYRAPRKLTRTCTRCGAKGLIWKESRTRPGNRKCYILTSIKGVPHECSLIAPTEFKDCS